jgi:hypothetical protein
VFPAAPSPSTPPRRRAGAHVDRSVNNYGINTGIMAGGSVHQAPPDGRRATRHDPAGLGVFVSYRRGRRHAAMIALIGRELAQRFGQSRVFLDVSSVEPGSRYPDALWLGLQASRVVLAVIHPKWLDDLRQRAFGPGRDWVSFEIETALRASKVLLPMLLDDAALPAVTELPYEIRDLPHRAACRVRADELQRDLPSLVDAVAAHL